VPVCTKAGRSAIIYMCVFRSFDFAFVSNFLLDFETVPQCFFFHCNIPCTSFCVISHTDAIFISSMNNLMQYIWLINVVNVRQ